MDEGWKEYSRRLFAVEVMPTSAPMVKDNYVIFTFGAGVLYKEERLLYSSFIYFLIF